MPVRFSRSDRTVSHSSLRFVRHRKVCPTLVIGALPENCKREELVECFQPFGEIDTVDVAAPGGEAPREQTWHTHARGSVVCLARSVAMSLDQDVSTSVQTHSAAQKIISDSLCGAEIAERSSETSYFSSGEGGSPHWRAARFRLRQVTGECFL